MQPLLRPCLALCLVALVNLAECVPLTPASRSIAMDKTGWTTHCFGRFLIDLPPQAEIRPGYRVWQRTIHRLHDTRDSLAARIRRREQELKALRHSASGAMFVRRIEHGNGSVTLLSWDLELPNSTEYMTKETYLVAHGDWRAYEYKGGLSATKQDSSVAASADLARNLRSREPNEIPTGPGFCIDGGYIAGDTYQNEGFMVGVTFPDHPGAHFDILTTTGAAEKSLLKRLDGFVLKALGAVAGITTLRKGPHPVGPLAGEEYLIAGSDKGQRAYSFAWDVQGKNRSLTEPHIEVGLGVLERNPDNDGNPPPPAFRSDQDALALWDAIVGSIRLRPGAASSLHLGLRADSGMPCPWPGVWVCDDQPDAGERIIGYGVAMPRIDGKVVTWRMVRGS